MPTARNPQTARFLERFPAPLLPLPQTTIAEHMYGGRYVTRPLFLDAPEWPAVYRDIDLVRTGLVQLGRRCFGGDLAAFGRAVGMNER